MSDPKVVRLPLMVTRAEAVAIDEWRYKNRIPSRAEAIRQLIERGLRDNAAPIQDSQLAVVVEAAAIDITRVRKYPAAEIADIGVDTKEALNIRVSARLRKRLHWLAEVYNRPMVSVAEDALQADMTIKLRQLGVKI